MKYSRINGKLTTSTPKIDRFLKKNYLSIPIKKMSLMIEKSDCFVRIRMRQLGLVVPIDIKEQRMINGQFKKGAIPTNKGKKMSADVYEKIRPTMFKKGHKPKGTYENDGVVTTRIDKEGRLYKYIRISISKWELYHRYLWELKNGKVPNEHCLWFINGDSTDCRLENIELITRGENAKRNRQKYLNYPEEILKTSKLINKLNKKIKDAESNN
mgnify:FL=1